MTNQQQKQKQKKRMGIQCKGSNCKEGKMGQH